MRITVIVIAAAAVIVPVVSYLSFKKRVRELRDQLHDNEGNQLPSPEPSFLVGNRELKHEYYKTIYSHATESNAPATLLWIGSDPFLVLNCEEGVQHALSGGHTYIKPRYVGYRSQVVKAGIESQKDAYLHQVDDTDASRRRFNQVIASKLPVLVSSMKDFTASLPSGSFIDVHPLMQEVFVRLNVFVLFDYSGDVSGVAGTILSAGGEFSKRMLDPLRAWYHWPSTFSFIRDVFRLLKLGRNLVAHLDKTDNTWVHAWIARKKLTSFQYFGKVLGLVMASTQTVPLTSMWLLHLLAAHPDVREKALDEIHRVLPDGRDPSYTDLEQCEYLGHIVHETLRLYPPFPLLQREAVVDDSLDGYSIPAGTKVYVVPWLIHHHPRYWSNPHEFRPERFEKGPTGDSPSIHTYIPFGRGPRMCAGSGLAIVEMKLIAIYMLRSHMWKCDPPKEKMSLYPDVNMMPLPKIRFLFERLGSFPLEETTSNGHILSDEEASK